MPFIERSPNRLAYHLSGAPLEASEGALVLLHGAGGSSTFWGLTAKELREAPFPVVRLDLPGHGDSSTPESLHLAAYAGAVEELCHGLQLQKPVLGGHSMGGAVALSLALRGVPLAGLALISTGAKLRVMPALLERLRSLDLAALDLMAQFGFTQGADSELVKASIEEMKACPPEVVLADFLACDAFDVRDRIHEIDVPALVCCGEADLMTPPKFSRYLAESLTCARFELVPEAAHMLPLERPARLAELLKSFCTA